jgi:hypothetical protein
LREPTSLAFAASVVAAAHDPDVVLRAKLERGAGDEAKPAAD